MEFISNNTHAICCSPLSTAVLQPGESRVRAVTAPPYQDETLDTLNHAAFKYPTISQDVPRRIPPSGYAGFVPGYVSNNT